jgi:hypothetical protein
MRSVSLALTALAAGLLTASLPAADIVLKPSDDYLQYPFAGNRGGRTDGFTFTSPASTGFNYRDSMLLFRFRSGQGGDGATFPTANAPTDYNFTAAKLTVYHATGTYSWDPTTSVDGENQAFRFEVFGMGFGPTFTDATWNQSSAFSGSNSPAAPPDSPELPRDPYPLNLDAAAVQQNVTDVIGNASAPTWGTASYNPADYTPNVPVTTAFPITFTLDVSNPRVRTYLQQGLANNSLNFVVSSVAFAAIFPAPAGDAYPRWVLNGTASPSPNPLSPTLTLEGFTTPPTSVNGWEMYH